MGIKSLSTILNTKCKSAIHKRNLESYQGLVVGIDISIYLYKYLYFNDDHLEGITRLLLRLIKHGILPVVMFDGRPPKEKSDVLISRKEKREYLVTKKDVIDKIIRNREEKTVDEIKSEIEEFQKDKGENMKMDEGDIDELLVKTEEDLKEELEKTVRRIIYVRAEHIESTKRLCDLMGIPYIVSKGEAESLLAHLCREGILDACISEDTDVLANGGRIFIRNLAPDKNVIDEYCLEGILSGLEMTYEQFMDMCILCGCDYTSKIGGMGPQTAYKMIKKYGNIENSLEEMRRSGKYQIPSEENFNYVKARDLFMNSTREDNRDEIRGIIQLKTPQIEELCEFMRGTKLHAKYFEEIRNQYMSYFQNYKRLIPDYARQVVIGGNVAELKTKKKKALVGTTGQNQITNYFLKKEDA